MQKRLISSSVQVSPSLSAMMAAAMKNRSVLAGGLAVGVVGYAAGNYLGFLMAQLLAVL